MKRTLPVFFFLALAGLGLTGCVTPVTPTYPTPTAVPTATPNIALNGTYSGVVTESATDTFSDGSPSSTASWTTSVTLIYNSSNVLTLWSHTLPNGSSAAFGNPQAGSSITYTNTVTVSGASGTVTDTIQQATYTANGSVLSGTSTFSNGSTGYHGNGTFVMAVLGVSGGAKVSVVRSWTIQPPSGTPVTSGSMTGNGTLTK